MSTSLAVLTPRGRAQDVPQPVAEPASVGFVVKQGPNRVKILVSGADWNDPAAWGMALADLARQFGDDYAVRHGVSRTEALERIRRLMEAEWDYPT